MMKKILEWKLAWFARMVLKKYQPSVIGVTGSVGKTSTKEAIYAVLKTSFRTGKNVKNYNNEIGVPLAILGEETGRRNLFAWLSIFWRAVMKLISKDAAYPEMLVIEMGADKEGDIEYLTKLAPCTIGVVTAVSGVHLEFFKTFERVISEKRKIVSHLPKDGWAVLNADDSHVLAMKEKTRAKVITFGFSEGADVRGTDAVISQGPPTPTGVSPDIRGISFKVIYQGSSVPMYLPSVLGQHQVRAGLAAVAVGISFGLNLLEIAEGLKQFTSPPGRMNLLKGIKETRIIDDSYNSSPHAALAGLNTLKELYTQGKKIAALGDMAELGDATVKGHEEVGMHVATLGIQQLVTVGEKAKIIAMAAEKAGMPSSQISSFDHPEPAGRFIQSILSRGDIVFVKGSQVARMEKIVKELMAEPLKASQLLVRQGEEWL
ncbi:MAG: UDP-N-acetylmuramoyl-tripeptide--D-alanyl-D-alanine ligase [Parcubacteria group bacterium]